MIYVCFDTNIYVRLLTSLEEKNLELSSDNSNPIIEEFRILSSSKVVKILLPEVIELEIKKHNATFKNDYIENYNKLVSSISEIVDIMWNEVRDIKKVLLRTIDEVRDKKICHWESLYKILESFFNSNDVDRIELTPDIICITEKRRISGMISQSKTNDSYIIDSIYSYADNNHICMDDVIYLITENKHDFFDNNHENGEYHLKECFLNDKYKVIGLCSLDQYNKHINLNIDVSLPKNFDTSFEKRQDFDGDEYINEFCDYEEKVQNEINRIFEGKMKTYPEYLQNIRIKMLDDISVLLKKCRGTKSWDDRSELKLYLWLENRTENEIPATKLSDLVLIKDNLQEYLEVHLKMDQEENS